MSCCKTWWFANDIDYWFQPNIRERWPEYEHRHDKVILQDGYIRQWYLTTTWKCRNGMFYPQFTRDCLFRIQSTPLDDTWTSCSALLFFWKSLKLRIASKDEVFFRRGIRMLSKRWEIVRSGKRFFQNNRLIF